MSVMLHITPQVPLAHANQLPLLRLLSAAVLRVFSCKKRYIKYTDLYLYLFQTLPDVVLFVAVCRLILLACGCTRLDVTKWRA